MLHVDDFGCWTSVEEADSADWVERMDESTRLTWLWSALFGPLYFAAHGFPRRALLALLLDLTVLGVVVLPFLARGAWRRRARERASFLRAMLAARSSIGGQPMPRLTVRPAPSPAPIMG